MRKLQIVGMMMAIAFGGMSPTKAANPDLIRQLLQTNGCPGCDLTDADLRDLDLTEADLSGANLAGANLSNSTLLRANLVGANLQGVTLTGANLTGANLTNADFTNALNRDTCSQIYQSYEEWEIREFDDSALCFVSDSIELGKLMGFDFCEAATAQNNWLTLCSSPMLVDLVLLGRSRTLARGANLSGANLSGADLSSVDLRGATLIGAQLSNTDLSYALLLDAELPEASSTTWEGALRTADDIAGLLDELTARVERNYRSQASRARESEAKNWIGAINRSQQAYRLENIDFAATLEELQIGLPSESDRYSYAIESQPAPGISVMATARAKEEGLRSYTGAVFVIETGRTISIICETDTTSMTPPEMPAPPKDANERP